MPEPAECRLLLASASPRRRRLLGMLGMPYRVTSADIPEDTASLAFDPALLARTLAADKARAVRDARKPGEIVVAFDTIVVLDGSVLGKPSDIEDAYGMLRALSGREHDVVTGVAVLAPNATESETFAVLTRVLMRELSAQDMREWAERGELLGCAGAYNIESHLATVETAECFQNVAGLPLCRLWRELATGRFGTAEALTTPLEACEAALGRTCELGRRETRGEP